MLPEEGAQRPEPLGRKGKYARKELNTGPHIQEAKTTRERAVRQQLKASSCHDSGLIGKQAAHQAGDICGHRRAYPAATGQNRAVADSPTHS